VQFEWDEDKRLWLLGERGIDLLDAALTFEGPVLTEIDRGPTMAKRATYQRAKSTGTISSSSTPRVLRTSDLSRLGEPDSGPDADIRTASLTELQRMKDRGELFPTAPDAEGIELDESFWRNARVVMPADGPKTSVHLRVDPDVFDWFKRQGKGHLTRMNAVLRAYYEANRKKAS
jgi:uncharacterized protein (DUF4415 family)/uncharacterized DUF497 family protein